MELEDRQKQECQVLLEEYKRLNGEISKRLDYIDKNISYQFVLLGIVATAVTAIIKDHEDLKIVQYVLLSSPILFCCLSFYYSINNMFIIKIAQYVANNVKKRMDQILQSTSTLGFEDYFLTKVLLPSPKTNIVEALVVLHWTLVIPLMLIVAFLFFSLTERLPLFSTLKIIIFVTDILSLTALLIANINQYRILRYRK